MNLRPLHPRHNYFSASREMINIVDRYFNFNRILLLIVGLWPYEKSKYVQLQSICIFSTLISCIILQLTSFFTSKYSADIIIKVLSVAFLFCSFVIKYNSFYVNSETIKYLMGQVQHIYNDLKDNNEFEIVEKYSGYAKLYTVSITVFSVCSLCIFMGAQLWPDFTYILLSNNVSRSHQLQISTEYFIDQEKYFYLLLFHINASMGIGCTVLIATGTMLIAYLQHACGMFKIASYRIERAIQIYSPKTINMQNKILVYKSIIHAVNIHQEAITFSSHLISRFEMSFMFLIAFGVLTLSLNIFRIVLIRNIVEEFLVHLIITSICFLYMFLANFVGQQIIDHYNDIFITVYKVKWYITPISIQKLIIFLLQRGNKKYGLRVGGLFIASLECFATLLNASVSYFTIMYSIQ